ncbi:hypothetical protein WJX81_002355 [Elliptochloris bilobata]|uniref:Probable cytosolic iron-sulfur protein assembly protein CIAO1 homolog n=1 Tax=Elliptochloris bilobata TaxID=381761 RepID=A0AAW1S2C2_9CHLO
MHNHKGSISTEQGSLEEVQVLEGHTDRVWCSAWSPLGDMLASCSGDRTVRIWSRQQPGSDAWSCSAILEEAQTRTIRCVAWSPNGRCLATASFDATTAIWEVQAGAWEQVALLEGHESEVKGAAWAPSGMLLATCSRDKSVWIWDAMPGHEYECADVKQGHTQDVKSVTWHPDGDVLVSTSYDDSIRLWSDAGDEWSCAQTLEGPGIGHESTVWGVAFDRDGSRAASVSDDRTLRLWRCGRDRGEPRWRLLACLSGFHERSIFSVDWGVSGIATGSGDNAIRVFVEDAAPEPGRGASDPGAAPPAPAFRLAAQRRSAHPSDVNCASGGAPLQGNAVPHGSEPPG